MTELEHVGTSLEDPSGAMRAQEAHDAGAVLPALEVPNQYATLHVVIHGSLAEARELVDAIAGRLIDHPLVVTVDYGITIPDEVDG